VPDQGGYVANTDINLKRSLKGAFHCPINATNGDVNEGNTLVVGEVYFT
jgi:hypothetical protein